MSGRGPRNKRHSWSSDEGSADSGSSIETQVDSSGGRRHRKGKHSGLFSSQDFTFTHGEERKIRRSLVRKLLSDDGTRLSRLERRLLRADHSRKGSVSVSTFKAALAAECKSGGFDIKCDEVLWFTEKLRGRDGRTVKILKMRALLEDEETGGHRPLSGKRRQVERQHHRNTTRRNSTSRRGESRGDGLTENGVGQAGNGGKTTSESDNSSRGGATRTLPWRSSPPPPARWAIRHGTVGQWLHEVAAPMERKLFYEFLRDLEKFERRNGLDHYRVRPSATPRGHDGFGGTDDGGTAGHCREHDGTTVVHLGPMLKASIRFFV